MLNIFRVIISTPPLKPYSESRWLGLILSPPRNFTDLGVLALFILLYAFSFILVSQFAFPLSSSDVT
jgi:hypothetical protein